MKTRKLGYNIENGLIMKELRTRPMVCECKLKKDKIEPEKCQIDSKIIRAYRELILAVQNLVTALCNF